MCPQKKNIIAAASLLMLLIAFSPRASGQALSIAPSGFNVSLHSSSTTSVNLSIAGITNLHGYQCDIMYNQNVLSHNSVSEGPFLKSAGSTYCVPIDTTIPGIIKYLACVRTVNTSVSGSGNLSMMVFNLNLNVVTPLTTQVGIVSAKLSDINSQPLTFTITNGTINIKACLSGETKACGSNQGECKAGTQNCLASNDWNTTCGGTFVGPAAELCDGKDNDCDTQYDENVTGTGNLSRGCSLFHSGDCAVGTEVCNGANYVGCPTGTTEICYDSIDQDCNGVDSTCQGDVANSTGNTPDGCIDLFDLAAVGHDFGKTSGFINPNADIDHNNIVDIFDLVYVGKDYLVKRPGATC